MIEIEVIGQRRDGKRGSHKEDFEWPEMPCLEQVGEDLPYALLLQLLTPHPCLQASINGVASYEIGI